MNTKGNESMELSVIDRKTVRAVLNQWPLATVAAQLAGFGFDKKMVREEFRRAFKRALKRTTDSAVDEPK